MNKLIISAALVLGMAGVAAAQEAPDYLTNQNISTNAPATTTLDQFRVNSTASKSQTVQGSQNGFQINQSQDYSGR
ncbi:MAG: hypothetical protein WBA44_13420 [Mesorhizobium sp.]